MSARSLHVLPVPALAALLLLGGCGKSASEEIASARTHLAQQDYATATIDLKNALQKEPQSAQARLLLGQALHATGAYQAAAIELGKALDAAAPADEVVPLLARTQLALGAYDKVTRELAAHRLSRPQAVADLNTSVGTAWMAQSQPARARDALRVALAAQQDYAPAKLLQARMSGSEHHVDDALRIVDEVLRSEPGQAEAAQLKGDLLLDGLSDPQAAIAAYREGLKQQPQSIPLRTALISALLRQGRTAEARAEFEPLRKDHPKHAQTQFFEAMFAIQSGDAAQAREALPKLLKMAPDNPSVLLMTGYAELRSGSATQAQAHLAKAVQLAPGNAMARRMLADVHLRTGQPAKATETLQPLVDNDKPDPEALQLAAMAALQAGDTAAAETLFARAAKAAPGNTRLETARALTRLARGDTQGIVALEALAARDSSGTEADVVLVAAHMRQGEHAKALAAIDRMAHKMPKDALPEDLRGRVQMEQGDLPAARRSFERALALQPAYVPALNQLAALDEAGQQFEAARQRLEAARSAQPRQAEPVLALAALAARSQRPRDEVLALYAEARRIAPQSAQVRRAQVGYLLAQGQTKSALEAAQAGAAALPDDPLMLEVLGAAQGADGQLQQAVSTLGKLPALMPGQAGPYVQLAAAQLKQGDLEAAARSLGRAADIAPASPLLSGGLLALAAANGGRDKARAIAAAVQQQHAAPGHALQGDLLAQQKDWAGARAAYQVALKSAGADGGNLPARLHHAIVEAGDTADAERFAADWLRRHPEDLPLRLQLGVRAVQQQDFAKAAPLFRQVLQRAPANLLALNNLAWILAEQAPREAIDLARRGLVLAPRSPDLLDTLAHALDKTGQLKEALQAQQAAVDAAPSLHRLRVSLARLQLKAGDKPAARASLESVIKAGGEAAETDDARRLLVSL
jgi:putative PEP-CTERM system TPR-repeat lipoprotein